MKNEARVCREQARGVTGPKIRTDMHSSEGSTTDGSSTAIKNSYIPTAVPTISPRIKPPTTTQRSTT